MNMSPRDIPQTTSYRVLIAILFGLLGFGLNALNLQLIANPTFKVSILAGLFFPLLIALAWGWRYGLLSALAGGCQTMWWLWETDGWGIIYAVPVFTLWIVWHGWWADRRDTISRWPASPFIVEIPFRAVIELGFFTIFPWLVSWNPPPWNPDYTWNLVPLSWMTTAAIKHILTSYILLLATYVTLSLGPVRQALGLRKKIAQQDTHIIYAGALLMGLFLWATEAWFHYQFVNDTGQTFWDIAVFNMGAHDTFMRVSYIFLAFSGAAALIPLVRRRARLQRRFDHQNKVLKAIRNVNKLITQEKEPGKLIQGACDCLIATRGYENAWIVLLDNSRTYLTHAQAGMTNESATVLKQLCSGRLTARCRRALESSEIVITKDPRNECTDCPLAQSTPPTHACMTLQLRHQDTLYGLIAVILPRDLLNDPQEQSLFREIADDLAYALHGLEVEKEQKNTLEALQKSEQRFSKMLQKIPGVAIQGYGADGRIHFWNQASEALYGYTEKEALGKNLLDLIIPVHMHDDVRKHMKQAVETGKMPPASELELMHKNGKSIPVLSHHTILFYDDKDPEMFCIDVDLTQIKKTEAALKASQAEIQSIFRSAPVGIGLVRNRILSRVNERLCDMIGYTQKELLGQSARILYPKQEDYDLVGKDKYSLIHKLGTGSVETRFRHKNGSIIDVILSSTPLDPEHLEHGVTFTALDITIRKNAEKALRKSEENLSTTLHSIGDAVISTDAHGNVANMNPVAERLTGWKREQAHGKPLVDIFNIINAQTRNKVDNPTDKVFQHGKIIGLANHTILIAKDGNERQIADSAAPIHDTQGNITGVVLVFRDVTEEYHLQNELRKIQKLESIGTLAGGIAHDFNNILMGIFGNIEMAKIKIPKNHPGYKFLQRTQQSMDRATHLTNQLRTFAKGGSPVCQDVLLETLIKEITTFDLSGSKIKPVYKIADDLWHVSVDKGQIQQVFSNLTLNAKQAMSSGGELRYTLENKKIGQGDPSGLAPGKYVKITVQDQGIGIPPKDLDRIFDPYFSTKKTGSGLGLATVYSIIAKHHGHISVSSRHGKGTTFCIYLSASDDSQDLEQTERTDQPFPPSPLRARILVMDDEAMIREVMTSMLKGLGFSSSTASDGKEALKIYKQARDAGVPFDAVIMDLTIPGGLGGKEAVQELLQMAPEARAIVSSGYAEDPILSHFEEYGFKGMITKPYTMQELQTVLHKVLEA